MSQSPRTLDYDLTRVLLVDDDPTFRLTLKTVLDAGGYSVDSAANAPEAGGKVEEGEYELVLSYLQMQSTKAVRPVFAKSNLME